MTPSLTGNESHTEEEETEYQPFLANQLICDLLILEIPKYNASQCLV